MPNVEENGSQVQEAQEGGGQEAQVGPLTTMGDSNTISEGIYIGNINVSGKTAGEAKQDVEAYIEELKGQTVTFQVMDPFFLGFPQPLTLPSVHRQLIGHVPSEKVIPLSI